MLKKFNSNDIFINRIKTHPKTTVFINSGKIYYNNNFVSESSGISLYNFLSADLPQPIPLPSPLPSDYWHESNEYYSAGTYAPQESYIGTGGSFTTAAISNSVIFRPFFVGRHGRTIREIGFIVTTAPFANQTMKLGLYDCFPPEKRNVYPRNKMLSIDLVLPAATTGRIVATLPSPITLENGLYWLAMGTRISSTAQIRTINSTGFGLTSGRHPLQWSSSEVLNQALSLSLNNASDLPDTVPTGSSIVSNTFLMEIA